ncbi:hypothetical protein G7Y89_g13495 [Cudoniella acicularis]|uniref:Uncharacterized protein n=1 Tax=Cudoniella acicularis TaxID=354080 RepID=A0A8H4R975_9HELO|nr:hypothetical protein G7Y89_g13495 [Cudoniella acicularis]
MESHGTQRVRNHDNFNAMIKTQPSGKLPGRFRVTKLTQVSWLGTLASLSHLIKGIDCTLNKPTYPTNPAQQKKPLPMSPTQPNMSGSLISRLQNTHNIATKFSALCGPLGYILLLLLAWPAARFLPPLSPTLTPDQVVQHYVEHEAAIKALAVLFPFGSAMFLLWSSAVAEQLGRIPSVPKCVVYTQPPELTQLLNDATFLLIMMNSSPSIIVTLSFSYGALLDQSTHPLFPRKTARVLAASALFYVPALATHCARRGPLAWDGALSF